MIRADLCLVEIDGDFLRLERGACSPGAGREDGNERESCFSSELQA